MPASAVLKHDNGAAVTAQEAYDAFMNTRVLIVKDGATYEAISMVWYDNNSAQTDLTNVGYVKLSWISDVGGAADIDNIKVGDSSLVPTQQG